MKYLVTLLTFALWLALANAAYGDDDNTQKVKEIFEAKCKSCHKAGGILFDILDVDDLITKNIVQGVGNSKLYEALNRPIDPMPKGGAPLNVDEKGAVLKWLKDGYPKFEKTIPNPTGDILAYGDQLKCAVDDAKKANVVDSIDYLYFQIGDFYKDNPDRLIEAINTHFNGLSFTSLVVPGVVLPCGNDPKSILRLNIRDLNQTRERIDTAIADGKYPYFIDRRGIVGQEAVVFYEEELARITRTKTIAFLRGDWFVSVTGQAPIYYDLLFKDVKVKNLQQLERDFLKVDTFRQIFVTQEVKRAIMQRSGVALFNRVIDQFRLDFAVGPNIFRANYWKSYDFADQDVNKFHNAFATPFGPLLSFYPHDDVHLNFLKDKQFKFDAEELIFQSPNGYLGFAVVDGNEKLIDKALTTIAVDTGNVTHPVIGDLAGTVVAGNVTCLHCHSNPAMNAFQDQGRNHVLTSTDFTNEQRNFGNLLFYKDQKDIAANLKTTDDSAILGRKQLGLKKTAYAQGEEPVFATAKYYFDDLDVCDFGRELGFKCDDIKIALQHAPNLARLLNLSDTLTGRASRLNVENLAAQIAIDLNLGRAVVFKKTIVEPPPPPFVCKLVIKNKTVYPQKIEKIVFGEKKVEPFWINKNGDSVFEEKEDGYVDACLYFQSSQCLVVRSFHVKKCGTYVIRKGDNGYSQFYEAR